MLLSSPSAGVFASAGLPPAPALLAELHAAGHAEAAPVRQLGGVGPAHLGG